jgi:hypothetical protein
VPGGSKEQADWFNELQRITVSGKMAARISTTTGAIDVSALLPQVSVPTLVLHARDDARSTIARRDAGGIRPFGEARRATRDGAKEKEQLTRWRSTILFGGLALYLIGLGFLSGVVTERLRFNRQRMELLNRFEQAIRTWRSHLIKVEQNALTGRPHPAR